jgi:hypothetical protein
VTLQSNGPPSGADGRPRADLRRGARILILLLEPSAWIHRRVESVSYTTDGLVRRSVSVDFSPSLPDSGITPVPSTGMASDSILVPLALLKKEPLALLDVRDESGSSLPVLATEENGFLAYSALSALACQVFDVSIEEDLSDSIGQLLYRIALDSAPAAVEHVNHILASDSPELSALAADAMFKKLAMDLAVNFILLPEIHFESDHGSRRRIAKFSYVTTPSHAFKRSLTKWIFAPNERTISFDLPSLSDAQSYHFQFSPPGAVVVAGCSLLLTDPFEGLISQEGRTVGGTAHLRSGASLPGTSGQGVITLSAAQHGLVVSALVSSSLNTLVICVFLAWALVARRTGTSDQVAAWQALFVAVPGLTAGFLAHQGEPGLLSRMLSGARVTLLISAVTTMCVALALAVGVTGSAALAILVASAIVGAACCTRLMQWYVRCRRVTNAR